ncbi:MAG: hypothetical protein KDA45_00750 [Planctomycetales bacterium]|nr:hypothetical protein [Planctomycetales bacterium]
MSKPQRGGEPLELVGGPLGDLAFQWAGDRYHHQWRFAEQRASVSLLSVESDSETLWPLSPPLQQIHRQSFGDGREVIFGVGMAGRGHWSASFTLVPELKCWIVELACRAAVEPQDLVSTYRLQGQWTAAEEGAFRCDRGPSPLCVEAIGPGSTAELQADLLTIRPQQTAAAATTQWAFRLRA